MPGALANGDNHLLSEGARERFADARKAIPAGAQLKVDPASWRRTGAAASVLVTMTMTETGQGQPRQFMCVLVFEEGQWKVSATYLVSQP